MEINRIEYINALAPFDHGVWEGKGPDGVKISVGDTALFRTRSLWLVDKITTYLIEEFSLPVLKTMTILEVGSYDGWVLTQICQKIKFLEVIGIEPRRKNIKKGEVGRELAKVETQARFIEGNVEDLEKLFPDRDFDIVICLGMLHHVSATYGAISSLCKKSSNIVILDSMIIPELQEDAANIHPFVNTRDIVYNNEESTWSVAAFKYESPYGDGSCANFGIVNVPSTSLIKMSLRSCGFGENKTLGDETEFFDDAGQSLRGVKELLLVSRRELLDVEIDRRWKDKVENSENIFCRVSLPDIIVLEMAKLYSGFSELDVYADVRSVTKAKYEESLEETILSVITSGTNEIALDALKANIKAFDKNHLHIISIIFRSPYEKILLEASKFFLEKQHPNLAIKYLQLIVRKPGCDWWSFYRACYLLSESFKKIGAKDKSKYYQDLLVLSNENFPFVTIQP